MEKIEVELFTLDKPCKICGCETLVLLKMGGCYTAKCPVCDDSTVHPTYTKTEAVSQWKKNQQVISCSYKEF